MITWDSQEGQQALRDRSMDRGPLYEAMRQIIPEDSWVRIAEFRTRRFHKVFATNGDVLTYCNRWLKRERVELYEYRGVWTRCRMCVAADR